MADSIKKRRRWPYAVFALLMLGGAFACLFRPLNATERRVVGHWVSTDSWRTPWTFLPNRTFHWLHASGQSVRGTWSCSSSMIEIVHYGAPTKSLWMRAEERVRSFWNGWDRHSIDFTPNGNLLISSLEYVRVPNPEQPDPAPVATE